MLNRRLVRIRVMQTLYAYEKGVGANFELSNDLISDHFAPDLNSPVKQDKVKLSGLTKMAHSYFSDEIKNKIKPEVSEISKEIQHAVSLAKELFKTKNNKDFLFYKRQIVQDAETVHELYLNLLASLVEIQKKSDKNANFSKNQIIINLSNNKVFQQQCLLKGIRLYDENTFILKLCTEAIFENPHFVTYQEKVNVTFEDQLAIVKYLIKNVLLKHEAANEYFEKKSIFWIEDKEILRTMLFHTFPDENADAKIELLDEMWDETKEFMQELFESVVKRNDELLDILVPKLKNWEFDRVIETDRILLKMAIVELTQFPSIPVKVTINEIIEISKNYSSLKSGNFVNGILDGLIKSLTASNSIKKTGRGMLDNK